MIQRNNCSVEKVAPSQARSTRLPLYLLALITLLLLTACGSAGTTSSSTGSGTSSNSSSGDTSGYGGKYGNGGGASSTPAATVSGPTQTVTITTDSSGNFTFAPKTLTIAKGTTVIWKNTTSASHTVTSDDKKSFNSGISSPINSGATFSFKFTTAGSFPYHCDFHPFMMATIIVQ